MIFREFVDEVREYRDAHVVRGSVREFRADPAQSWPISRRGNLVMAQDTAVELGHPRYESAAFILCTDDVSQVTDGRISLIGPDVNEPGEPKRPLGKIVLVGMRDWNEETLYERYQELDLVRFETALVGYMLRATPQNQREWSRVSHAALKEGFSLRTLGSVLYGQYRQKAFVDAVEMIFVTSSPQDVKKLQPLAEKSSKVMGAMNKMFTELELDCASCEYFDVCEEVMELRALRNQRQEQRA